MAVDIAATGFIGIGFEATAGTYVPPTKFMPIRSESLKYVQETVWRRLIRGVADVLGAVAGDAHVEGDIVMEVLPDCVPYFLYASRNTIVKTGAGPYVYTSTPYHGANPVAARTLSITVVRNGLAFGYTGCVVGSMKFGIDNAALVATYSLMGRAEATQTLPTPTYTNQGPFGAGMYTIQVPTGSTVTDVQTFELSINDNATPEYRLQAVNAAAFMRYGERSVEMSFTRDFQNRTEYDAFKALTVSSIRATANNGASAIFQATLAASLKDTYEISGLANQGDLIVAQGKYIGTYDTTTSKAYEIVVTSSESIT